MSQYDTLEQKAVALKYDETQNSAPVIVASGMGYVAEKIVEIAISKMKTYEGYLESLGVRILRKQEHLADLKEDEIKKRTRMIEAKKEFTSIQKLKEKKQEEYRKQEQKENETLIEEFVSSRTAVSKLNG